MAAVHSSCRLCIHLATVSREKEEKSPSFKRRPCKCTRGLQTVYHIYVRERGRFEMESIYLRYLFTLAYSHQTLWPLLVTWQRIKALKEKKYLIIKKWTLSLVQRYKTDL